MVATRKHFGVWSFTNGSEYYDSLLKWHLSVNLSPSEVHEIGLSEVTRIKKEMERVSKKKALDIVMRDIDIDLRHQKNSINY